MKRRLQPPRLPGQLAVGDLVAYYSVIGDAEPYHTAKVRDVWANGIPSCRERMVLLEGKAGCVLESHCKLVEVAL